MGSLFGRLFDLNHDGHASPEEEIFGLMMFDELQEEEKRRQQEDDLFDLDLLNDLDKDFDDDTDWDD